MLNTLILWFYYNQSAATEESELSAEHAEYRKYILRSGRFLPRRRSIASDTSTGQAN